MTALHAEPSADRPAKEESGSVRIARLAALGGMLGALGAASCCIAPLVLFSIGISGAWIGNLAALAPYQPYFIVPALAFLALGYYIVYRKPKVIEGAICAHPNLGRLTKPALWSASVLISAALAFPYVAPALLGV